MSDTNKDAKQKPTTTRAAESKARGAADKATAPASRAGQAAADKATAPASRAGQAAADKAADAASAAKAGTRRSAEAANGAVRTAAKGAEAGRRAVVTTSGQVAATAKTAWTVIAHRKLVAAGVGAGLTALSAASYAVGRRAGRHPHGPLTRLTGGRI
ncbi:hypothetical protein [Streptomyces lancefieldiae]|uniref:Uncharacterized protein n=1 Tax=Streptomyces lancefieldiae TaxID=3075520 RepID=A0ABU3AH81_9ACTN|nr:hypothetical protein [Streptomyces sp. DSM 40712]MDT0609255.1 hypothetical protein [Streptomyces sp. DSM 40712]